MSTRNTSRQSPWQKKAARSFEEGGLYNSDQASEAILKRVPPHNVDAEQAIIGGILMRHTVLNQISDVLVPEDFYMPAHQIIYSACLDLYSKNIPADLTTLADYLTTKQQIDDIGGTEYLANLAAGTISAANAEFYAEIVRDKAMARSLINVSSEIIGDAFTADNVPELLDRSEQAVFSLSERTSGKQFKTPFEILPKMFDDLAMRSHNKDLFTGVRTGYGPLDQITLGLQPSDLIIVAARPSMGKTAFALNLCLRAALYSNVPVAIYSLEMSTEQLVMRMLCTHGKVELSKVRKASLSDEDFAMLHHASDTLSSAPIYIDDTPALSTLELRARTRRLKAEKGVGMIMVDYLQLMRSSRRTDSRELEISDISRSLKALAKELNVPVVALSQLNRKVEERSNKRPLLSDLRESGAIEQDADVIMFIYRDDAYDKREDNPRKGVAEIIIGKQRNGPVGTVELAYLPKFTAFEELTWAVPPPKDGYAE